MCGIAGFIGRKGQDDVAIIKSMVGALKHRGPDAEGFFLETVGNQQIALGHSRLSIIDTSITANQPMLFDYLTIAYNGEVYNFAEIKAELTTLGYDFTTHSDTEVILKAFHRFGMEAVNKFRGMFSFCILDKRAKKVYLVRDRVGVKPLYYFHQNNCFVFASEIKALQKHPDFNKVLCAQGLNLYLQYGYIPAPYTIYQGIYKVKPGHCLEIDLTQQKFIEKKYWDLSNYYALPKLELTEEAATNQLQEILSEAFAFRMIADVPVGVLLSGGIDSSLVAAMLQATSKKPIQTFTMGFENNQFDESESARKIAQFLGTHHHEQICNVQDAASLIPELPQMYDEPFADSSAVPTALIAKFAKQKVTVALSGDGGDEMFCGYSTYPLSENRFKALNKLPLKRTLKSVLNSVPDPIGFLYKTNFDLYNRYLKLKATLNAGSIEEKFKTITRIFSAAELQALIPNKPLHRLIPHHPQMHALEKMMLIDFQQYLPDDILVKVDRATMYYSLEGREPLLDHHLLEFTAQLPIQFKHQKRILKTILAKYLPTQYFKRKKQGFGVPVNAWLKKELRYLIDDYLNPKRLKEQGIFNPQYVKKLTQAFLNSATNDNKIWTLLVFQMWHQAYFS